VKYGKSAPKKSRKVSALASYPENPAACPKAASPGTIGRPALAIAALICQRSLPLNHLLDQA
jgi:hypothetical protein